MLTNYKSTKNVKKEKVPHNLERYMYFRMFTPTFFLFIHYFVLIANLEIRMSVKSESTLKQEHFPRSRNSSCTYKSNLTHTKEYVKRLL